MVPKGANIIRTSFSFNFLLSMPMNSLRSSTARKKEKKSEMDVAINYITVLPEKK